MSSNQPSDDNIAANPESSGITLNDLANFATVSLISAAHECMKAAKYEEAIEKYTHAISLNPDPIIFCFRAGVYCMNDQYEDAINDCRTAIELDPECATAYSQIGFTFSSVNRFTDAITAYKKALELDPENEDYKRDLAHVEENLKAEESPTPTAEDVSKANALKEEGNECMKESKFNEAIVKYTQAIALNQDPVYLCNRAAAHCGLQQYDEALNDCDDALFIDDDYAKAHGRMGYILSCVGLYVHAVTSYKRALELDPDNESYKENLVLAEAKLRDAADQS